MNNIRRRITAQSFILLLLIGFLGCSENDKKSVIIIDNGKVGMIGYGSLMSKKSMERTLGRTYEDSIYRVHLEGYQRYWNYIIPIAEVNPEADLFYIRENDTIPILNALSLNMLVAENEKMNCVLFFITSDELAQFDEREMGYNRVDVTEQIEELAFSGGRVYAYTADKDNIYDFQDRTNTVLFYRYLELVNNACDSIGEEFRQEFESSTFNLEKLNILTQEDSIFGIKKE